MEVGHVEQIAAPAIGAYVPGLQSMHSTEPLTAEDPAAQIEQLVDPSVTMWPSPQQTAAPCGAPVPAGQAVQLLAPVTEKVLMGHSKQEDDPKGA